MIEIIHNDSDLGRAFKRIDEIWGADIDTPEGQELAILAKLSDSYERVHSILNPTEVREERCTVLADLGARGLAEPLAITIEFTPWHFVASWQPCLYAMADTEEAAVAALKSEILDFHSDLEGFTDQDLGPELQGVKRLLNRVIQ